MKTGKKLQVQEQSKLKTDAPLYTAWSFNPSRWHMVQFRIRLVRVQSGKLWEQRRPEDSRQPRLMRCFRAGSQRGDKYLKSCEDNCERDAGVEATFPGKGITYILIDVKKTVLET